jgi:DNA-binding CsgD family transcriptional regulator
MLSKQNIAIVSPDFLTGYGLQMLLYEYFNPAGVDVFSSAEECLAGAKSYQLLLAPTAEHLLYGSRFSAKNKVAMLALPPQENATAQLPMLYTLCNEQEAVEQLKVIFETFNAAQTSDTKGELSEREREVLAKVAQGAINKEIADSLNISLNTVITHRKNITAKLGIKTISGLTVYAILNGIISAKTVNV